MSASSRASVAIRSPWRATRAAKASTCAVSRSFMGRQLQPTPRPDLASLLVDRLGLGALHAHDFDPEPAALPGH